MPIVIEMADLKTIGTDLVNKCYAKSWKVERADATFNEQQMTFHNNRAMLHDTLKRLSFQTVKRMVKLDVITLFYKHCRLRNIKTAIDMLAEQHRVLRNWPKTAPMPTNAFDVSNVDQATTLLYGIWAQVITIGKANVMEIIEDAIIEFDTGEYHCQRTLWSTAKVSPPSVSPQEQDRRSPSLGEPLIRRNPAPPVVNAPQPPKTPKKRKRANTTAEAPTPTGSSGTPSSSASTAAEPTPPKKKKRITKIKEEEREESPEIQWLEEMPEASQRPPKAVSTPLTPNKADVVAEIAARGDVVAEMAARFPMRDSESPPPSFPKPAAAPTGGTPTPADAAAMPSDLGAIPAELAGSAAEQLLDQNDPIRIWHRKNRLMKLAVCQAFENSCVEAIPFDRSKEPVKWMTEMLKLASDLKVEFY